MGISTLTAIILSSRDDLIVEPAGPNENGKYSGWITLGPDDYCRPILNTEPIFDTPEQAELHLQNLIDSLRGVRVYENKPTVGSQ